MVKEYLGRCRGFYIQWDSTNDCNLSCSHCYHNSEGIGHNNHKQDKTKVMKIKEIKSMLNDLRSTCDRWNFNPSFNISGGECLIRSDLCDIIDYSVSTGIETRLMTNGTLLNPGKADELKKLRVLSVQISIDGNRETYNKIRGRDWAYDKAMDGVRNCYNVGLHVTISTTLMKKNISQVEPIIIEAINNKARGIGFQTLVSNPLLGVNDPEFLDCFEMKGIYEKINELRKKYEGEIPIYRSEILWHLFKDKPKSQLDYLGGCSAGFGGLSVLSDGTTYACRRLPISIGHISEGIVKLVTENSLMKELRKNRIEQKSYCSDAPYCGGCRAIAYATTGNYLNKDPTCFKYLI